MYRVIKKEIDTNEIEVLIAGKDEDKMLDFLVQAILNSASNGDEYTLEDIEDIRRNPSEMIGPFEYSLDEVEKLTDEEAIAKGPGICSHCHSDQVAETDLSMEDGYVERYIYCTICGEETIEQFSFSGYE